MYLLSRKKLYSAVLQGGDPLSNTKRGLRQMKYRQNIPKTKPSLKIQRGQQTSAQLIAIAREIFSTRGYSNTDLDSIVREAGVTRGALYHHFADKKALFLAVFEDAQTDVASRIIRGGMGKQTVWEKFVSCNYAFFEACRDSELQRIILVDAPAVLGWDVWRRVDEAKTLDILRSLLRELVEEGIIRTLPIEALTHIISGAINETVMWIAGSEDPEKAFAEGWSTINDLLGSLRNDETHRRSSKSAGSHEKIRQKVRVLKRK
jgi:AcrR family transcriptional regulator